MIEMEEEGCESKFKQLFEQIQSGNKWCILTLICYLFFHLLSSLSTQSFTIFGGDMRCPKSSNCLLSNDTLLRRTFFFSIRNHFVPKEFKRRLLGTLSNEDTLTKTHFAGCNKYGNLCRSSNSALSAAGKTRLDRERAKMCQHEMVREKIGETIFPIPSCNKVCENHCKKSHATKCISDISDTFCKKYFSWNEWLKKSVWKFKGDFFGDFQTP